MSTGQMIMRASGLSIVAGLLALVTGCATTPWQSYSGTSLPDSQVARIAAETKSQTFWQKLIERQPVPLQITHVDGLPLGSFWGVVYAGLLVGVVRGITVVFYPPAAEASMFILMALILLLRPRGLMGEKFEKFE